MHSTKIFRSSDFQIVLHNENISHAEFFADFAITNRLGLFAPDRYEGPGASVLVMAYVTAFYDRYREVGEDFFAYPDFFSFQRHEPLSSHTMFDIWPRHKDVLVPEEPNETATAFTDRGINILLVPDHPVRTNDFERVQMASLQRNIQLCFAYSPTGNVNAPTLEITTKTEPIRKWSEAVFDSVDEIGSWPLWRNQCLTHMNCDSVSQSYREIPLEEALLLL